MRFLVPLVILGLGCTVAQAQEGISIPQAERAFAEAQQACTADGGKLWGESLCGPLIFADPNTRAVVANRADAEGQLKADGNVFVGTLPPAIGIANTGIDWAGVRWTMLRWPLPQTEIARKRLLAHEMFHRIQPKLGFTMANPANAHLDTLEGRIWLQMEYRALATALTREGKSRRQAIGDALLFRRHRQSLTAAAAADENALEINEGGAEYTGIALRGATPAENRTFIAERLKNNEGQAGYARAFAYTTGPAWGLLLDEVAPGWRQRIMQAGSFAALVPRKFAPAEKSPVAARAAQYGYAALRAAEEKRAEEHQALLAEYRRKFIEGPVLVLPVVDKFSFGFDPYGAESLDDVGTVYRTLNASDSWGVLEASGGALLLRNQQGMFTGIVLPAPNPGEAKGDGWELKLENGWKLVPGKRAGDLTVSKTD